MANITEEHLHHMARRHHATMKKLDGMRERFAGITGRFTATVEVGTASWLGGAIEGRTGGKALGPIPINLGAGLALIALGHLNTSGAIFARRRTTAAGAVTENVVVEAASGSDHLNNLGNGFIGSYLAATGFAWGKRWKESGKLFGNHSWSQAYQDGGAPSVPSGPPGGPPPPTSGWYHG